MEKKKMTRAAAVELLKNRKVYVNGKSAEIQKKLFELGFEWPMDGKEVVNEDWPFLYTSDTKRIQCGTDMVQFSKDKNSEISYEEILAIDVVDELKENDIVVCGWHSEINSAEWISIVKEGSATEYEGKVTFILKSAYGNDGDLQFDTICDTQEWTHHATEEERQMFINVLKCSEDGRAKHILKEVLGVEECPFKPFDKVLVRDGYNEEWKPDLFWKKTDDNNYPYLAISNGGFAQCIPYEGHESLIDTNKSLEE